MDRDYASKRSFTETPEPQPSVEGNVDPGTATPGESFMIHQHHATRLHFDLRLEMMNGPTPVLVSWAVPKNLPQKKGVRHLAVHVEDHPFDYRNFSGTIPAGNYGAGEVRIFDSGTYEVLEQEPSKLTISLEGRRMNGTWHLVRIAKKGEKADNWLAFLRENRRDPEPFPEGSPMTASLVSDPFDDDEWQFEPKWDGVRALATCVDETLLLSRNRRNITATYPELSKIHQQLVALEAIVDGEVVAMSQGRPSFERLQSRINLTKEQEIERAVKQIPVTYVAFDLLYLDGKALTGEPLERRRELLEEIVVPNERFMVSTAVRGDGTALYEATTAQAMEGIVAKRLASRYRFGKRSKDWLKIKSTHHADVVIGGWSPGEGGRADRFGSLIVGAYEDGGLRFVGSVGTGFTDATLDALTDLLRELETETPPFADDPRSEQPRWGKPIKNPHWVEPRLVATVEFRELTAAGRLRAPAFKGLRRDKDPEECLYDELAAPPGDADA